MIPVETVARADLLWPGETFRRGGRLLKAIYVAVTPGEPVTITAREVNSAGDARVELAIAAGELLRMVPAA